MGILNAQFANALGRPDLVYSGQNRQAVVGGPPTVVAGGSSTNSMIDTGNPLTGGGRGALITLMALVGAYAAFTWWVRPHLA